MKKMIKSQIETFNWLRTIGVKDCTINNGVVDVNGRVDLCAPGQYTAKLYEIPCQFGTVNGTFTCTGTHISRLDGAPSIVRGDFFCDVTNIKSLRGIEKIVKHIDGGIYCDNDVTNVLGLLLIEGLSSVNIDMNGPVDRVMNKYLGTNDILSAQDELIDAGCIEQARL